jgi:hypothetical protein
MGTEMRVQGRRNMSLGATRVMKRESSSLHGEPIGREGCLGWVV